MVALLLKHKFAIAISLAVLILVFGGGISNCAIKRLQGKIDMLNSQIDSLNFANAKLEQSNADLEVANTVLLEDNKQHDATIAELSKKIADGLATIHELEGEIAQMPIPEDCKPVVAKMQSLVDHWANEFSLAIKDRDEWKAKYSNLETAYANRGVEIQNLNTIVVNKDTIIFDKDKVISSKDKQLKWKSLEMNIYKYSGVAFLIAFIVMVVK